MQLKWERHGLHTTFLDLDFTVDGIYELKLHDKRDLCPFFVVFMPDLSSNIPEYVFGPYGLKNRYCLSFCPSVHLSRLLSVLLFVRAFSWNWIISFFLILWLTESNFLKKSFWYYLVCSCTDSIFGKNLAPDIWVKMLIANQIAGFLNNYIFKTKWGNSLIFCMLILQNLEVDWKIFGWAWSKVGVVSLVMDSKIDCISRMSWWSKLIFCMLAQMQKI